MRIEGREENPYQEEVEDFFLDNDIASYYLGVCQDFKHFGFAAYSLIAKEFSADEIKTLALLKWATPKVRVEGLEENIFVLSALHSPL